jgi:cytochrome c biogenesis protein CcmG, thiol:disulfide interchange protein DsbE
VRIVSSDQPSEPPGRARRVWVLLALAAAAVVVTIALVDTDDLEDQPQPVSGQPILDLDLPALDGGDRVQIRDFEGSPVIVNFWAAWCSPCRREMPALVDASRDYGDAVQFVGVNHQDNREDALAFAGAAGVPYPSGFDPDGETGAAIQLRGMPTTLFVDGEGRILERRTGEISRQSLDETIRRLFDVEPARR